MIVEHAQTAEGYLVHAVKSTQQSFLRTHLISNGKTPFAGDTVICNCPMYDEPKDKGSTKDKGPKGLL